jgi:peptidyl-prolyl cis-trans isomerase C
MGIFREPLVHFLALGALVYVATNHSQSVQYEIDAGPEQQARLAKTYFEQYGAPPTVSQLERALDEYVRNEILYREGLAMGLERDDEIVRRRVVQKIEFVNEDLDAAAEPDGSGLERYFAQQRDRYNTEPTVSFEQVFFSADRGGDLAARNRAVGAFAALTAWGDDAAAWKKFERTRKGAVTQGGDAFAQGREFRALTRAAANGVFGDTGLSAGLFTSQTGQWAGPFKSAYGWHLVRVTERQPAHRAELEAVRARVQADYVADLRERANAEAYRKIASKYRVITDTPRAAWAAPPAARPSGEAAANVAPVGLADGEFATSVARTATVARQTPLAPQLGGDLVAGVPKTIAARLSGEVAASVALVERSVGAAPSAPVAGTSGPAAATGRPAAATGRPRT